MPQAHREADQTEKAYQKQDAVFLGRKRTLAKKSKKGLRYVRNVGLGFKTPKLALEGSYVDKKCPFTGNVSIRGRILKGMVISTKMTRTVVIRRDYLTGAASTVLLPRLHRSFPPPTTSRRRVEGVGTTVTRAGRSRVVIRPVFLTVPSTQAVSRRDIRTCPCTSARASRTSRRATS